MHGANDGVRSALKKKAKENNALAVKALKNKAQAVKNKKDWELESAKLMKQFSEKQKSVPNGNLIWDAFADGNEEKKNRIREQFKPLNVDKFVDELAQIGVQLQHANTQRGLAEIDISKMKEAAKLALADEEKALTALKDYVEKKKQMKQLGPEDYQLFKQSFMNIAKNL